MKVEIETRVTTTIGETTLETICNTIIDAPDGSAFTSDLGEHIRYHNELQCPEE